MDNFVSPTQVGWPTSPTPPPADPQVVAVKRLVRLLEKASKSYRTYGATNPLARKFVRWFFDELTGFLTLHHTLSFLVLPSELYFSGEAVYHADQQAENLAFRLYADGIRELAFHEGIAERDLTFFLEALTGSPDKDLLDDDIVSRLWERDLTTITCVTAEEVLHASGFDQVLVAQDSGTLNEPVSSLREIHATEQVRQDQSAGPEAWGNSGAREQPSLVGYELSAQEMEALVREVAAESTRDTTLYILDMLTAILSCEHSGRLLGKLFDILPEVLDTLTQDGNWRGLNAVAGLIQEVEVIRPDLADEHKRQLAKTRHTLEQPTRIKHIEVSLNSHPEASTEGLLEFFLQIGKPVVPALCMILGNLESPSHRALVCKTLSVLAKEYPDPLVRALADPRDSYVLDLLAVVWNLHDPRFVEPLGKLVRHHNSLIRKKVLRLLDMLGGTGDGTWLLLFLEDAEVSIRQLALKTLASGEYSTRFSDWAPIVSDRGFLDRPAAEKRAIFEAIRHTSGEESVAYFAQLVTKRFWLNRKKREQLGVLAAATLGSLGSPAAILALRAGLRRRNGAIRQACTIALEGSDGGSPST